MNADHYSICLTWSGHANVKYPKYNHSLKTIDITAASGSATIPIYGTLTWQEVLTILTSKLCGSANIRNLLCECKHLIQNTVTLARFDIYIDTRRSQTLHFIFEKNELVCQLCVGACQKWRQMGVFAALVSAPEDYLVDFTGVAMFFAQASCRRRVGFRIFVGRGS